MQWEQVLTIVGANFAFMAIAITITISLIVHSNNRADRLIEGMRKDVDEARKKS